MNHFRRGAIACIGRREGQWILVAFDVVYVVLQYYSDVTKLPLSRAIDVVTGYARGSGSS